jgi:hypothetical protein
MPLILLLWLIATVCAAFVAYVLFQFTDGDDDDEDQPPQA